MRVLPHFAAKESENDVVSFGPAEGQGEWLLTAYLKSYKNGMCLASYSHDDRTLLHGFRGVLYLEDATLRRAVIISVSNS